MATWYVERSREPDGIDNEEVLVFEDAERCAVGAEERRSVLRERVRDLVRGHGSSQLGAQHLQSFDTLQRVLCYHRGHGRALPPDPQETGDHDDERGDGEVGGPAGHVLRVSDREVAAPPNEYPEGQRPADHEAQRRRPDPPEPCRDGDRADERRVQRLLAQREESERDREACDRQKQREPVPLACRVHGQPIG